MAKDKEFQKKYKEEGLKRIRIRKSKRNNEYIRAVRNRISGAPLSVAKNGYGSWPDPDSPTGYSQICSYYGTCQSPCNGDC
jgi:hypothetical protein